MFYLRIQRQLKKLMVVVDYWYLIYLIQRRLITLISILPVICLVSLQHFVLAQYLRMETDFPLQLMLVKLVNTNYKLKNQKLL